MTALGGALERVTDNPNNLVICLPSAICRIFGLSDRRPLPSFWRGGGISFKVAYFQGLGVFLCFNLSRNVTLSVLSKKWLLLPSLCFRMLSVFRPLFSAALLFGLVLFLPVGFLMVARSTQRAAPVAVLGDSLCFLSLSVLAS